VRALLAQDEQLREQLREHLRQAHSLLAQSDSFRTSPDPFIALMIGGFAIGVFGYLAGSKVLVGVGVTMIFLATLLIPLALNITR
jgi:hypothetical protein